MPLDKWDRCGLKRDLIPILQKFSLPEMCGKKSADIAEDIIDMLHETERWKNKEIIKRCTNCKYDNRGDCLLPDNGGDCGDYTKWEAKE